MRYVTGNKLKLPVTILKKSDTWVEKKGIFLVKVIYTTNFADLNALSRSQGHQGLLLQIRHMSSIFLVAFPSNVVGGRLDHSQLLKVVKKYGERSSSCAKCAGVCSCLVYLFLDAYVTPEKNLRVMLDMLRPPTKEW